MDLGAVDLFNKLTTQDTRYCFLMTSINRRLFLGTSAVMGIRTVSQAQAPSIPIIDCHIHLFDQTRPQGAPYSGGRGNTEPSLPSRYRKLATPLGIVGAIAIEASPWIEDNLWLLEVEASDSVMVGAVGNLQPQKPEFKEYLERYHKNKLFLGIRYGNLWGYNLAGQISNSLFIEGLKLLAQAGLVLDVTNPNPDVIEAIIKITDKVPDLRIVVDHVPSVFRRATDSSARAAIEANIRELAKRDQIYVKVSEVMQVVDNKPSLDPALYKPTLDFLFVTFGENRLIFGSDWPNGAAVGNLPAIVQIVWEYFKAKGHAAAEKYFWRNSVAAFKWAPREPNQPES
jgi:L-fuconolactonase